MSCISLVAGFLYPSFALTSLAVKWRMHALIAPRFLARGTWDVILPLSRVGLHRNWCRMETKVSGSMRKRGKASSSVPVGFSFCHTQVIYLWLDFL